MEIAIVVLVALVVLGPKRLPDAGRSLGKGLREFKDSVSGVTGTDAEPAAVSLDPAGDEPGSRAAA
jgi:sec-independent protein translocase protein TatA